MEFWTVRIADAYLQSHTFSLQSKDDCYLSANLLHPAIKKQIATGRRQRLEKWWRRLVFMAFSFEVVESLPCVDMLAAARRPGFKSPAL
jgi:hypothetical protein